MNPLSPREQQVFVLHFGKRRIPYTAIAQDLDTSRDHVRKIVEGAARKIADELERQEHLRREGRLVDAP